MSVSAFRRVFCISPSLPSATLPIHLFFSSAFLILLSIWPQTRTRKPINSYDPIFHVFFTSASSSSGNRNKSNTEASELYYAARLRPQRRPLYSNNNNRVRERGGGECGSDGLSATDPRQSKAMQQISQLYWLGQEPEERPIWASRWQALFVFVFILFLLILFYFLFMFLFLPVSRSSHRQQAENGQGPRR